MPAKREVLDLLRRDELLDLANRFELDVSNRAPKDQLLEALAVSRRASLGEMLPTLSRDCVYVGAEAAQDDGEPFSEKFARLWRQLEKQFAESGRLGAQARENLTRLGRAGEARGE